jgi:hypothetical protein
MFSEFHDQDFQNAFGNDTSARMPPLFGDYYREDNDVVRGTTINFEMEFCNPDFDFGLGKPSRPECMEALGIASEAELRFKNGDEPPELTPDIAAHLEVTNLQSSGSSPVEIGNKLLSVLKDTIGAHVTKLSRAKFTVRAQGFLAGKYFEIKVRVYKQKELKAMYLLDFQKRRGDATAFQLLFQQVKEALHVGGPKQTVVSEEAWVNIPQTVTLPPEQAIAPLLSMVDANQDVHLLAEVASGLSVLAQDVQISTALRLPCSYSALHKLESIDDFRVAVPTSCLLSFVYGQLDKW